MSDTGDRVRELADTIDYVEDEQGSRVSKIGVEFKRRTKNLIQSMTGGGETVLVFELRIVPGEDSEELDQVPDDVDDEGVTIEFDDEAEAEPAQQGGSEDE